MVGARTVTQAVFAGGQYGVFYSAAPYGSAFSQVAWVEGLQQNQESRSNLALVNTGEVDDSQSVFAIDIYDGDRGLPVKTITGIRVPARGWRQINSILRDYAQETTQGYVRIRKISGNNPFLALRGYQRRAAAPGNGAETAPMSRPGSRDGMPHQWWETSALNPPRGTKDKKISTKGRVGDVVELLE